MGIVADMIKGLKRGSKEDYIPGSLEEVLDRMCPICDQSHLARMKPCCGNPNGYIWCKKCNYKEQIL